MVFLGEPTRRVEQLAVAIVLATLVVETVTDIVTDDCTDSTIIDGIISIRNLRDWRQSNLLPDHDRVKLQGCLWTDDYLAVFAQAAGAELVTLDQALSKRYTSVRITCPS